MKRFLTLFFCWLMVWNVGWGQCPTTTSVTLSTQAEVDAFDCANYAGSITIQGGEITNLNGMSELVTVGGNLLINNTTNLVSINFPNLTDIDAALRITTNASLNSISFPNLLEVGTVVSGTYAAHSLYLNSNALLLNIDDAFPVLQTIGNNLYIGDNAALSSINTFNNLTEIGLDIWIRGNGSLTSIEGLTNITQIKRELLIENN
ncbi:MAG: hypothetical protein AB8F94_24375, partial [Saprospiraceae bacterium]